MQPLLYASSGTLCSHASQHEQDPEFVDGHHGPLTAEQKAECVALQPQCIQRPDDSVRYRKHFDDADKDKDGFLNLQVCTCLCEVDTSLKFGAQEFQGLTAESDADAGEDEHIKALFAEVDTSKDGKVILPALLNPLFSCAHYCVVVNLPSWKMTLLLCTLRFSVHEQVSFEEYLGDDAAKAPQTEEHPAAAAA